MTEAERLARLLCEMDGFDPDIRVTQHVMPVGPKGSVVLPGDDHYSNVPAWALYVRQAQYLLEKVAVTYNEDKQ